MSNDNEINTFTPHQSEVLTLIGATLLLFHRIEFLLSGCLMFIVCEQGGVWAEDIEIIEEERERKMLGALITPLCNSFNLEKDFEIALRRFLRNRNRLIHGLTVRSDYDFYSKKGLHNIHKLVSRILTDGFSIEKVLIGCRQIDQDLWQMKAEEHGFEYQKIELGIDFTNLAMEKIRPK